MSVQVAAFGSLPDGRPVHRYTLTSPAGLVARVIDYGATLTELHVPDRNGRPADVVLGFDNLHGYLGAHPYFGSTVGRVANRIAGGSFILDGMEFVLATNDGPNHLHGGVKGFDKALWDAAPLEGTDDAVRFRLVSPDGDEGYPGELDVEVVMAVTAANSLVIDYTARTDRPTPVNLTNHAYFNLAGAGIVLDHELAIHASRYTPADGQGIPTGDIRPVAGTPFDFTRLTRVGKRWGEIAEEGAGYDHNYVIDRAEPGLVPAARLVEPVSGRTMEVLTTQPGLQLYTGNFLDGTLTGKGGWTYHRHAGLSLETQHFPDAIHHPGFPDTVLRPGETLRETTVYAFSPS